MCAMDELEFIDDESLLDKGPGVELRFAEFRRQLEDEHVYDPHGRNHGYLGTVQSPQAKSPMSPIAGAVTVDLMEELAELSRDGEPETVEDEDAAAAAALGSEDEEGTSTKKRSADSEEVVASATVEKGPPKKKAKTEAPKKKKKSKKQKRKERRRARKAAAKAEEEKPDPVEEKPDPVEEKPDSVEEKPDTSEDDSSEDEDGDATMYDDDKAAVDKEMPATQVVRNFMKAAYDHPGWRTPQNDEWVPMSFLASRFCTDEDMWKALSESGYRGPQDILLASVAQSINKMSAAAKNAAHRARKKGFREAEEIDKLASKFIENEWHFKLYEDYVALMLGESVTKEEDRKVDKLPDEEYEKDGFVVDDDDSVGEASESDLDVAENLGRSVDADLERMTAEDDKPKSKNRLSHDKEAAPTLVDDQLDALLEQDVELFETPVVTEVSKGKGKKKKADAPPSAWTDDDIYHVLNKGWEAREMVRSIALDVLKPISRMIPSSANLLPNAEFDKMLWALLKIARHVLTPNTAKLMGETPEQPGMWSIVSTAGDDIRDLEKDTEKKSLYVVKRNLEKKEHFKSIAQLMITQDLGIEKTVVPEDAGNRIHCIWTGERVTTGQDVYRVTAYAGNKEAGVHNARLFYVSEAKERSPDFYIHVISAMRASRYWMLVFVRKLLEWQRDQMWGASVKNNMRMESFLRSDTAYECAGTTLAEYFANQYVVYNYLKNK